MDRIVVRTESFVRIRVQFAPPSQGDENMVYMQPLAKFLGQDWLYWWQFPLLAVLIGLVIFLKVYRNRQL
jgi:hypothetical protein